MKKQRRKKRPKKNIDKKSFYILIRYCILLGLMFTLPLIYRVLTPPTVFFSNLLLKSIYQTAVNQTIIFIISKKAIEIAPQCVAGSAYLLLLILNLSVSMNVKKRIYSILLSVFLLFLLNILRIFFLTILWVNDFQFFQSTHKLFWYVLSTIFVIGIWLLTVYLFKIKSIPIYTDLKYFFDNIKTKRKNKK